MVFSNNMLTTNKTTAQTMASGNHKALELHSPVPPFFYHGVDMERQYLKREGL